MNTENKEVYILQKDNQFFEAGTKYTKLPDNTYGVHCKFVSEDEGYFENITPAHLVEKNTHWFLPQKDGSNINKYSIKKGDIFKGATVIEIKLENDTISFTTEEKLIEDVLNSEVQEQSNKDNFPMAQSNPLFTTDDGVDIYDLQTEVAMLWDDYSISEIPFIDTSKYPSKIKIFSTKEAAQKWVMNNKHKEESFKEKDIVEINVDLYLYSEQPTHLYKKEKVQGIINKCDYERKEAIIEFLIPISLEKKYHLVLFRDIFKVNLDNNPKEENLLQQWWEIQDDTKELFKKFKW